MLEISKLTQYVSVKVARKPLYDRFLQIIVFANIIVISSDTYNFTIFYWFDDEDYGDNNAYNDGNNNNDKETVL